MNKELYQRYQKLFDEIMQHDAEGREYWSARDLQTRLGYATWENFDEAVGRAIASFKTNNINTEVAFRKATKSYKSQNRFKEFTANKPDYHLTRGACYVIAMNGDPTKQEIAAAQLYFALQTYRQETTDQRTQDWERLDARQRLTEAESMFNTTLGEHGLNAGEVAVVRSNGDAVFFGGNNTATMKKKLKVPTKRSLADYLPTVSINGKAFVASMTSHNTRAKNLTGFTNIDYEHRENSGYVRNALELRDIQPELLPAETDIRQVKIRLGISKGPNNPIAPGQTSLL